MLIQRVNRTDAEKIFMVVHNVEETSITTGMGMTFVDGIVEPVSSDGISVMRVAAVNDMAGFAGIASQDIVKDGYGLAQVWGYIDSIMFSHENSNKTILPLALEFSYMSPSTDKAGAFVSKTDQTALSIYQLGLRGVQVWSTVGLSNAFLTDGGIWGNGFVRAL